MGRGRKVRKVAGRISELFGMCWNLVISTREYPVYELPVRNSVVIRLSIGSTRCSDLYKVFETLSLRTPALRVLS